MWSLSRTEEPIAELFFNSTCNLWLTLRLRRLVIADRYFFVACNVRRIRSPLGDRDFQILARVIDARR
jgi:hypothetical protein